MITSSYIDGGFQFARCPMEVQHSREDEVWEVPGVCRKEFPDVTGKWIFQAGAWLDLFNPRQELKSGQKVVTGAAINTEFTQLSTLSLAWLNKENNLYYYEKTPKQLYIPKKIWIHSLCYIVY